MSTSGGKPSAKCTTSALAFVLAPEQRTAVQNVRRSHDKAYDRWPPHINFLFPFVSEYLINDRLVQLQDAISDLAPFDAVLDHVEYFRKGQKAANMHLSPSDVAPWKAIYDRVLRVFPELQEGQREEFVPHMTLGQFSGNDAQVEEIRVQLEAACAEITVHVEDIHILTRGAETPFSVYCALRLGENSQTIAAKRRREECALRRSGSSTIMRDDSSDFGGEDAEIERKKQKKDRDAALAAMPITERLNNTCTEGPQTVMDLLKAFKIRSSSPVGARAEDGQLPAFFEDDCQPGSERSAVAVDTSGSTAGSGLTWSIDAVEKMVTAGHPIRQKSILSRTISWGTSASVRSIYELSSTGATRPERIFDVLPKTVSNLLITTDGEIPSIAATRAALKTSRITNVIAVLVMSRSSVTSRPPSTLDLSVFFPFFEHCRNRGGSFYLVHATSSVLEGNCSRETTLRLLMKHVARGVPDPFPEPPSEYTADITWANVPVVRHEDFAELRAAFARDAQRPGTISCAGIPGAVNINAISAAVSHDAVLLRSKAMDKFVCDVLPEALQSAPDLNTTAAIRSLVSQWRREWVRRIHTETGNADLDALLKRFDKLRAQRIELGADCPRSVLRELALLSDKIKPLSERQTTLRRARISVVDSVSTMIGTALSAKDADLGGGAGAAEEPESFKLEAVARAMSNRARRAQINVDFDAAADEDAWDLTGAAICPECLVCARDDQPAAFITVAVSDISTDVFAGNMTDAALDDALAMGPANMCTMPAGNFCVSCAFACAATGQHPMTRQPVAAVIPAADLSIRQNRDLTRRALYAMFYDGKQINSAWLIFLGSLLTLKDEKRFPDEVIDFVAGGVCRNVFASFLPEGIGRPAPIIDAIAEAIMRPVHTLVADSYLEPLRNRSATSAAMMARALVMFGGPETKLAAVAFARRAFVKTLFSRVLSVCKENDAFLAHVNRALENDLYDCPAIVPTIGSAHITNVRDSYTLRACFNPVPLALIFTQLASLAYAAHMEGGADAIIPPYAFTAILCHMWNKYTRRKVISDVQIRVEDAIARSFSSGEANPLVAAAFYDVIDKSTAQGKALENTRAEEVRKLVEDVAPYRSCMEAFQIAEQCNHNVIPGFASHLFSPSVSHCDTCGTSFVEHSDAISIKQSRSKAQRLSFAKACIDRVAKRRSRHFKDVFNQNPETMCPSEGSCLTHLHKSVREVLTRPEYQHKDRPTREIVVEVLKLLTESNHRGGVYGTDKLTDILICVWDFLQKRASGAKNPPEQLSLADRLAHEFENDAVAGTNVASLAGLSEQEIAECTAPVDFDPAARPNKKRRTNENGDDDKMN